MRNPKQKIIESWMLATIRNGGLDRYDDLHIDKVDESWKSKSSWIDGSLRTFRIAAHAKQNLDIHYSLGLAIRLDGYVVRAHLEERTSSEYLSAHLSWTPPSLYLFKRGQEFWRADYGPSFFVKRINIPWLLNESHGDACYLTHYLSDNNGEPTVTLFVADES